MLASGGTKVPEQYTHMDGGIYRGHWRGGRKEGLGVYTYPSGARYEGQWRDNLKHGLGSYHFPKVCVDFRILSVLSLSTCPERITSIHYQGRKTVPSSENVA